MDFFGGDKICLVDIVVLSLIKLEVSFVEIQGRENLYDIQLKDGNLLRSIQSATVSPLSPGTKVDWGVRPEQLLFFNSSGKRL